MDWSSLWQSLRKYVLNKYVLTFLIAGVVFLFVGEQSVLRGIRRSHRIHETREQISLIREDIRRAEHDIRMLQSTDSLERFAREQYYMHTSDEDVYLVSED